jgi:uncharacterized membrane protein (UPF0127 family)
MKRSQGIALIAVCVILGGASVLLMRTEAEIPLTSPEGVFGGVSLTLEYATTPEARARGLGRRTTIPPGYGMLFVFPEDDFYGFWMKDTLVPLDIFWLDAQGQVVSIAAEVATSTFPYVFYPSHAARYVLETESGFARAHHIVAGMPLLLKNFPIVSK